MDKGRIDLINHLYAIATGLLNEAEELAVEGQSPSITAESLTTNSESILAKMEDTSAIVKAAQVIASEPTD
ncbi:MAG: hypothetical protein RIM72_16165 [Alphaproteobacteria bacterium]